jgi:hypothetical protein
METLIITTKNKRSASQLRKILKNIQEVETVKTLSEEEKEDIGLSIAIEQGFTGDLVDVEMLQNKLNR